VIASPRRRRHISGLFLVTLQVLPVISGNLKVRHGAILQGAADPAATHAAQWRD
jgi:hypothetical protein